MSEQLERARREGMPAVVSMHASWPGQVVNIFLSAHPDWLFLTVGGLARRVREDPIRLREDPVRVARLADEIRIHHRIGQGVLVSLDTAGLILSTAGGNTYATPPSEFWRSYASGAVDSSFGAFLGAVLEGRDPREAVAIAATAFAVFRGRPAEERGLPSTWSEIQTGPIARIRPLPRTQGAQSQQADWDQMRRFLDLLDTAEADPSRLEKEWNDLIPGLGTLMEESFLSSAETQEIVGRLFRLQERLSNPSVRHIVRAFLVNAMKNRFPAVREFVVQQWLQSEQAVWQPAARSAFQAIAGAVYRIEIDGLLLDGLDAGELQRIQGVFLEAAKATGGQIQFGRFHSELHSLPGVRRVALLTPDTARAQRAGSSLRVLPVQIVPVSAATPQGRTRLISRAILLALAVAGQPDAPAQLDSAALLSLQRYFQFLGVAVSRETLEAYFKADPDQEEDWLQVVERLTVNLNIAPLEPLLTISFEEFLEKLAADLSV